MITFRQLNIIPCLLILISCLFLTSCDRKGRITPEELVTGIWRAAIFSQGQEIPFLMEIEKTEHGGLAGYLINGEERIRLDTITRTGDSLHIPMHVFDSGISARLEGGLLTGFYIRHDVADYRLPFEARHGIRDRFPLSSVEPEANFNGKWRTYFISGSDSSMAIGIFRQGGRQIEGTFLTKSGDYRFLSGIVEGNIMQMSTFDGSFIYLFRARMQNNGIISGEFWSGKSGYRKWVAFRDEDAQLPDPYTLTGMRYSDEPLGFRFPNPDGQLIGLDDERYRNKPVVVEIMGTWCPNCMDESRFLAEWYSNNKGRGVEVIGLAFERKDDFTYGAERIRRSKEKLGIGYEILFAGSTSEESRRNALPLIEKLASYPTTIFLDRQHHIVKVHAGFSGPGTGAYYDEFVAEFESTMDQLIGDRLP